MRKLLFIISCFFTIAIQANDLKYWENVIEVIIEIESKGDVNAISPCGNCVGPMQIKKIVVDDCNEYLKIKKINKTYSYEDRWNLQKSKEMFVLIQQRYNKTKNIEKAVRIWNGGCCYNKKNTEKYFNRFLSIFNEKSKV